MDWANERYVRVYTRDTVDWLALSWQARALLAMVLRKVDRAGVIELGRHGVKGLAVAVGMPVDVVEPALGELLEDGCVERHETRLVMRNFIDAQEATQTDAQRARESRANRRDRARGDVTKPDGAVTNRDATVTPGHTESQAVTSGHSVLCQTSLPEPPEREGAQSRDHAPKPPRKSRRKTQTRCPSEGTAELDVAAWARSHEIDASHASFPRFLQWHRDEDKPRRNWLATWSDWITRDAQTGAAAGGFRARRGDVRGIAQHGVSPDIELQRFG